MKYLTPVINAKPNYDVFKLKVIRSYNPIISDFKELNNFSQEDFDKIKNQNKLSGILYHGTNDNPEGQLLVSDFEDFHPSFEENEINVPNNQIHPNDISNIVTDSINPTSYIKWNKPETKSSTNNNKLLIDLKKNINFSFIKKNNTEINQNESIILEDTNFCKDYNLNTDLVLCIDFKKNTVKIINSLQILKDKKKELENILKPYLFRFVLDNLKIYKKYQENFKILYFIFNNFKLIKSDTIFNIKNNIIEFNKNDVKKSSDLKNNSSIIKTLDKFYFLKHNHNFLNAEHKMFRFYNFDNIYVNFLKIKSNDPVFEKSEKSNIKIDEFSYYFEKVDAFCNETIEIEYQLKSGKIKKNSLYLKKYNDNKIIFNGYTLYGLTDFIKEKCPITDITFVNFDLNHLGKAKFNYLTGIDEQKNLIIEKSYLKLPFIAMIYNDDIKEFVFVLKYKDLNKIINNLKVSMFSRNREMEKVIKEMENLCTQYFKNFSMRSFFNSEFFVFVYSKKIMNFSSDFYFNQNTNSYKGIRVFDIRDNMQNKTYNRFVSSLMYKNNFFNTGYLLTGKLKYTFGIEIETSKTSLLPNFFNSFSIVRDGSITGGEYVTTVLEGNSGINYLHDCLKLLSKTSKVDHKCGIHFHIGNIKFNKYFTVAIWKLSQIIETEIFDLLPKSRIFTRNEYYISKGMPNGACSKLVLDNEIKNLSLKMNYLYNSMNNYSSILRNVEKLYSLIFSFLACDINAPNSRYNKKSNHRSNYPKTRYYWINLVASNFAKKTGFNYTVEFRNHPGSLNYHKIKNYLLLCMAIVNYTENNYFKILNCNFRYITLYDIITEVYGKDSVITKELLSYIIERKSLFQHSDKYKDTDLLENSNLFNFYETLEKKEYGETTE